MVRICLPKSERDKLADALRNKSLTIRDLYGLKTVDRRKLLEKYVGKDFAQVVNAKFEAAMVSKQKTSITRWIEDVTSAKDPIRRDMIKKVERVKAVLTPNEQGDFLSDLAESKLGLGVTEEEAGTILRMKNQMDELKEKIPKGSTEVTDESMAFGMAVDDFKEYVGQLKLAADTMTLADRTRLKNLGQNIIDVAGTTKSLVATLDNSFIGRQGIKALLRGDYKIWTETLLQSFQSMGKEMMQKSPGLFKERDDAVMKAIRARVFADPNYINGKYSAAKNGYGLGVDHEEAFPTSLPSRIPFLGRVFKASETAFTGSAITMRMKLANSVIAAAEENGVDMLDEVQATAFGNLVSSLTGRGELTTFAASGEVLNATFFAPRFLKANFNTLTGHLLDSKMAGSPQARRMAAQSTLKIAASLGTIMTVAKMIDPDSVDFDPRGTNFGKIKIGNRKYDITGGMSGLAVFASRIVPTFHNGEFGFWTKSASTGKYTKMTGDNFGEQTALDVVENFFQGKLSPAAGVIRDVLRGSTFGGEKPSVLSTAVALTVPISAQILEEELKKGNDDILVMMIAESLGFSSTDSTFGVYGKRWQEMQEKVGPEKTNEMLKGITERYNKRSEALKNSASWEKMTNEEQGDALTKIKREENERVLKSQGI